MLIEFAITNFRSIRNRQVFSMLPSDRVKDRIVLTQPIKNYTNLDALPLAVIYGANNSGKSNLVRAFGALKWLILTSHKITVGNLLSANENFAFDTQTQTAPTIFELDFIATDKNRYLFIVEFSKTIILREELYIYATTKTGKTTKRKLYVRKAEQAIEFGDEYKGIRKPIEERLIENMLFLSKAVQEKNIELRPIMEFFQKTLQITNMSDGDIDFQTRYFGSIAMEEKGSMKIETLNVALRSIDSGISNLEIERKTDLPQHIQIESEQDLTDQQKERRDKLLNVLKHEIKAGHRLFDGNKEIGLTYLPLKEESDGTRKFIAVFTKLMDLTASGGIFIVDELERSFHPLLTQTLIHIIINPATNPNQAQLIFTTHDTTLFDVLDRDQINILEKNEFGATEIYTVSDIRGLRSDNPLQKWYMSGKLSGIPNINSLQINQTLQQFNGQKQQTEG